MAFHWLPLGLQWYSDGLGVTATAPQYNQALGARVLKIGSMNPRQLESAVAPYISYENAFGLLEESTIYMLTEEVLQELHLTSPDGRVEFTLAKSGVEPFTLFVAPVDGEAKTVLVSSADGLHVPPPLYRKHPNSYYWYEYLPDSQTLYIQYNRCQNDPHLPFADFAKDLFTFADGHTLQRVVIDLRFNGGGNSTVINPLLEGLKSRTALSARGHLYGLMGRATFSSGFLAAINLRDDLAAILVGEPSGEKPNSYGEVKTLTLPNTQLEVQYSTKFFKIVKHKDPQALAPDIVVRGSLEDALAGRDPVLDAALHHPLR
ncbi:MAG TPA: hypothetical protein VKY85_17870 [Candidatus Angelobacter sp.]|nr:hypothetical protein [Candidatus Angelobacter sp.]